MDGERNVVALDERRPLRAVDPNWMYCNDVPECLRTPSGPVPSAETDTAEAVCACTFGIPSAHVPHPVPAGRARTPPAAWVHGGTPQTGLPVRGAHAPPHPGRGGVVNPKRRPRRNSLGGRLASLLGPQQHAYGVSIHGRPVDVGRRGRR